MRRRAIRRFFLTAVFALTTEMAWAGEQVVIVGRFYPAPGREAELEARLMGSVSFVKKAEPNITYRLHRSSKEPTVFLYYEIYPSQAAFDRHRTETIVMWRKEAGPPPEGIFSRPPEVEVYKMLAE
jgi:quinol monooxygenase YgiN